MNNETSLLDKLRLEHDQVRGSRKWSGNFPAWISIVLVTAIVLGGAYYYWANAPAALTRIHSVAVTPWNRANSAQSPALQASGYVVANRKATVSAKITGKLASVMVEEGQHVDVNQIIALLDDSNARAAYAVAEAGLRQAQLAERDARAIYERSQRISAAGISTPQALEAAKSAYDTAATNVLTARASLDVARRNLDDTTVRSPFAGVVTDVAANSGEIVSPFSAGGGFTRTGICTIVDMESLEVDVDVSEDFINQVRDGQPATITLSAYPGVVFPATVLAIVPTADRNKGTVKVRVRLEHKDPRVLPEMSAHVDFLSVSSSALPADSKNLQVVPESAVLSDRDGSSAFVVENGRIAKRSVSVVARLSTHSVVVRSDLRSGDVLVDGDLGKLSDGQSVEIQN